MEPLHTPSFIHERRSVAQLFIHSNSLPTSSSCSLTEWRFRPWRWPLVGTCDLSSRRRIARVTGLLIAVYFSNCSRSSRDQFVILISREICFGVCSICLDYWCTIILYIISRIGRICHQDEMDMYHVPKEIWWNVIACVWLFSILVRNWA